MQKCIGFTFQPWRLPLSGNAGQGGVPQKLVPGKSSCGRNVAYDFSLSTLHSCVLQGSSSSPILSWWVLNPSGSDSVWRRTLRSPMSATWTCTCLPLTPKTSGARVYTASGETFCSSLFFTDKSDLDCLCLCCQTKLHRTCKRCTALHRRKLFVW